MLKLDNIVKNYVSGDETVQALRGVSIEFRESEFTSILGPSGCGKTTMLNIIGGLDRYTSGDLSINGKSTKEFTSSDWDAYRNHNIGFIFQSYHLIPHLNVLENVELALTLSGVSKKERRERAKVALEKVGLKDQMKKMPNQMSGGQMQRVSIARALVNDPDIILADEPTGALDTNTSVQIMDILAEISQTKLVIMVTHNPELAKKYSTRIVSLLDGGIVGDTDPYISEEDDVAKQKAQEEADATMQQDDEKVGATGVKKQKRKPRPKTFVLGKKTRGGKGTYMPFWMALTLSFRNLLTKKARTILIAVAGSIGIIGVGLVFAVQNGFDAYVDEIEETSLVGVPIMVSPITYDSEGVKAMIEEYTESSMPGDSQDEDEYEEKEKPTAFPESDNVIIKSDKFTEITADASSSTSGGENIADNIVTGVTGMVKNLIAENVLDHNFVDYCQDEISSYGTIQCQYDFDMHLASVKSDTGNAYWIADTDVNFTELVSLNSYVSKNYQILAGSLPKNENEIVVILDKYNRISSNVVEALGLDSSTSIKTGDLINDNCPLKLISNDGYYELDEGNSLKYNTVMDQDKINATYASSEYSRQLKVVGVLRVKQDADNEILYSGIGYTTKLWQTAYAEANKSEIVLAQKANSNIDVFTGKAFTTTGYVSIVLNLIGTSQSSEPNQERLRQLGGDDTPILMLIYVDSFSNKNKVKALLDDYNEERAAQKEIDEAVYIAAYRQKYEDALNTSNPLVYKTDKELIEEFEKTYVGMYEIVYTDMAEMTTDTIGSMIDIISVVLACFAGISLVVSSLMIGIITYISVVERTKEIGILRSIGARKIDISNVFNAETIIIGTAAGLIGILMTYILSIPINLIIKTYAGIGSNIAALSPLYAVGLVLLSIFLTFIAGLLPARLAAHRDPVVALRSE